jgi:hypothetical protein
MVLFLKSRYRLIRFELESDILAKLKTTRVHTLMLVVIHLKEDIFWVLLKLVENYPYLASLNSQQPKMKNHRTLSK